METMTLEEIIAWPGDADPHLQAEIRGGLLAAIRERDELRAELAALRKRIADAPIVTLGACVSGSVILSHVSPTTVDALAGKRVRLVTDDE